jgi:hypothetical protein
MSQKHQTLKTVVDLAAQLQCETLTAQDGCFSALGSNNTSVLVGTSPDFDFNGALLHITRVKDLADRFNALVDCSVDAVQKHNNATGSSYVSSLILRSGRTKTEFRSGAPIKNTRVLKNIKDSPQWRVQFGKDDLDELMRAIKMLKPAYIGTNISSSGVEFTLQSDVDDTAQVALTPLVEDISEQTALPFDHLHDTDIFKKLIKVAVVDGKATLCYGAKGTIIFDVGYAKVFQLSQKRT